MKRMLILILAVLPIIFCTACRSDKKKNDGITYESGIYHNKNWSETVGTYSKDAVIPDEETALRIAESIFDGMKKSKEAQEYVPQHVFYDNQDEIWIVSFWKNSDMYIAGGDCSIAMQKKDGKVLRIWFGE